MSEKQTAVRAGDRFSMLTVLRRAEKHPKKVRFECVCDCGTVKVVAKDHLIGGSTKSCGCHRRSILDHRTHGARVGQHSTPAYRSWKAMKARCSNPNDLFYRRYGGRGIKVCERWHSFENFLADMGERPSGTSIDRIDNDGNYEPSNCKWSTVAEQNRIHAGPRTRAAA